MIIKFNPSGTHIHKDKLKVRLDFYPDATDKAYEYHYVDHYDREPAQEEWENPELLELIPAHKELNPCLCMFVQIDETTTLQDLQKHINDKYDGSFIKTLDDNIILTDSAHRVSALCRGKNTISSKRVSTADETALVASKNIELRQLAVEKKSNGESRIIEPQSITLGNAAIDRASSGSGGYTRIDMVNPADGTGTIDTWEMWFATDGSGFEVATFYEFALLGWATHDYEEIGDVTAGSKQTFSGLDTDVETGEYAGCYFTGGSIERDLSGTGYRYASGDWIPNDSKYFSTQSDRTLSLYGTGTESGGEVEKLSAESGAGVETKADFPGGEITGGESGNGVDTESELEREVSTGDTAAGIESGTLDTGGIVERYAGETGTGSEAVGDREIPASESGTGTEMKVDFPGGEITGDESGNGVDTKSELEGEMGAGDTAAGMESITLDTGGIVERYAGETGTGTETAEISEGRTAYDSGAGNEESVIIPVFFGDDSAIGLDLSILFKDAFDSDAGDSDDRLKALVGSAGIGAGRRLPGGSARVQIPSEKTGIPSKGVNK
ncbi:MAG: hypothetical protein PVG61_04120 [Dehalococcoidia bacterium]|jgi:hypothetical protein